MTTIKIIGSGSALPENIVTNKDLEKIVDTNDEWIVERTGISERRRSTDDTVVSLATKACQKALESANVKPEEVELIIVATCSAEEYLPCCACSVQKNIGAVNAFGFDLNAACSGFLFALSTAKAYIASGMYKNALIVGSEVLSKMVDWKDRSTCILFGDGAGALMLEKSDDSKGIISISQGNDGFKGDVLSCKIGAEEYITMDGQAVYRFATRTVPKSIKEALEKANLEAKDIDYFFLHQANIRILESISKQLGVEMSKIPSNLKYVGNTSSAAIPILYDEFVSKNPIKPGSKIVMSGFGAGLTYGACVIEM